MKRRMRRDDLLHDRPVGSRSRAGRRRSPRTFACLLVAALACLSSASAASAATPTTIRAWLARHPAAPLAARDGSQPELGPHALGRALGLDARSLERTAAAPALGSAGGTIEGEVTSSATKEPLAGIEVCAFEPEAIGGLEEEEGPPFKCSQTVSGGTYAIAGLAAGSYVVEFRARAGLGLDVQPQFYKGATHEAEATRVSVEGGSATAGIDAALLAGGEVTGRVTSALTKAPLAEVIVCAVEAAAFELGACALTGATGEYTVEGLASGKYVVAFVPLEEEGSEVSYATQFYDGAATEAGATPVGVVAGGSPAEHVNAALVEGVPQLRAEPAITGSVVAGQTLSVRHASWTNGPTSFVDTWGRCNAAGEKCFVAGTGPSYTLAASDVGHTMIVREVANDAAGASEPAFSPVTPPVAAAPVAAPAAPAPAAAKPAPAAGVLSSTSAMASAAQLRSLLVRLLVPSGRGARIGQLLKHRGYSVSFAALAAGKLTISWYVVPHGAHLSGAKPVLVASGSVSSAAAGAAKLTIKLTAKGRGLLAHAARLGVTAKGVLKSSAGTAVSATKAFVVKR